MICIDVSQEFFSFANIFVHGCHLGLCCLLQISQTESFGDCTQHGVVLQVNSVFYEFLLYEITTQLNNACDLKLTSCEKNFKYALLVDMKITSVDGPTLIISGEKLLSFISITSWFASFPSVNMAWK